MNSEGYATRQPDDSCIAYWDKNGSVWSCGYGSTGSEINKFTHWTRDEATNYLLADWSAAKSGVLRASPILGQPEHVNRLEAITDFAYNLGVGRYQASSLRAYVDRQSWAQAADEFPKWDLAGGKVLRGLVVRRAAERTLFLLPVNSTVQTPPPASSPVSFGTLLRQFLHSLFG